MNSINIKDIAIRKNLDASEMSEIRGGSWGNTVEPIRTGGTIKTGDYETGTGDTGPSWEDWEPRPHVPQTPKPKSKEKAFYGGSSLSYFGSLSLFRF